MQIGASNQFDSLTTYYRGRSTMHYLLFKGPNLTRALFPPSHSIMIYFKFYLWKIFFWLQVIFYPAMYASYGCVFRTQHSVFQFSLYDDK